MGSVCPLHAVREKCGQTTPGALTDDRFSSRVNDVGWGKCRVRTQTVGGSFDAWQTQGNVPAQPTGRRLHLRGVAERPAGVDEQIGDVFRKMRMMTGWSRDQVARQLGTSVAVIELLEAGALRGLPAWPQTQRIITSYGALVGIDARPLLRRIAAQLAAPAVAAREPAERVEPIDVPTMPQPASTARNLRRRRRARRAFYAVSAPMLAAGLGIWLAHTQPPALMAAVNALPTPISRPIRTTLDYILMQSAPRRDGLRWIEVSDPRTRKSDRLAGQAR